MRPPHASGRPGPVAGSQVRAQAHSRATLAPVAGEEPIAAWASLLRTYAAVVPKLERALARTGLPLTWYDVLLVTNAAPGRRLRMTELGRQAVVSRERVSRVVTELEAAGLIERQPNPDDRRSSFAAITPEGRRRLREAAPVYLQAVQDHYLAHLTAAEVRAVARSLAKVVAEEA
jgi:DNA-binding MarR family transcriptional regulator